MRSLLFDFPEDREARKVENEFMFGPSLLVCAVTEPMYYGPESTPVDREKTWGAIFRQEPTGMITGQMKNMRAASMYSGSTY